MSKRIGLYLTSFSGGGAEREMIYLANEFANRGFGVDLFIHRNNGPLKSLVDNNVNQIIIDKNYLHDIFILAKYMRKSKPLFILSTLHIPNWTLSFAKLISFTTTRISWRVVISLSDSIKDSNSKISKLYSILYPLFEKNVDKIVCVSSGVAKDLVDNFLMNQNKIEVMYNPAYNSNIHELANQDFKHQWFNSDYKTVVALGRLATQKDFITLIKSFELVRETITNARLVIFGDGALKNDLEALIKKLSLENTVELFGFELNPYKYLAKADLFVLSSKFEGFGNVIVEALALNIPVVSTDCPSGPAEILENGEWGKLVPVGDSEAMANAIIETLNTSQKIETLERAKEFSVEKVADNYIEMFSKEIK